MYSIGQVAEMFGLPISTLRYYDKQGLFPNMERVYGIRKFGDTEIEALLVIECLKKGWHGDQRHPAIHGLVCRMAVHLPATQGTV